MAGLEVDHYGCSLLESEHMKNSNENTYVISADVKTTSDDRPQWNDLISSVEGIVLIGATMRRAQVVASDTAIAELKQKLGRGFTVEPVVERSSQ